MLKILFFHHNCVKICVERKTCWAGKGIFTMNGRFSHLVILSMTILIIGGCAHAISRQNRLIALKDLTPESILQEFETYKGRLVLMGGEIIETKNLETETLIEILQKPLSRYNDRPIKSQEYGGRFLVRYNTFKDPYIFSKEKEITVAGIVVEKEVSKIGQREYTYLVLENRETHLWPERIEYYGDYPYGYPPLWWNYSWWPYWYPRPYRHSIYPHIMDLRPSSLENRS